MNGNGAGKRFERKFREAMEPHGFVLRIPNSVQPRVKPNIDFTG